MVIQARRNNNRVGPKPIEEVVESRKTNKCERAIVVTNIISQA
jgi:HJR/Mrr/RecB family endonuclease